MFTDKSVDMHTATSLLKASSDNFWDKRFIHDWTPLWLLLWNIVFSMN